MNIFYYSFGEGILVGWSWVRGGKKGLEFRVCVVEFAVFFWFLIWVCFWEFIFFFMLVVSRSFFFVVFVIFVG